MKKYLLQGPLAVGGFLLAVSCLMQTALADEICRACPFDCAGIGAGRNDCRNVEGRRNECCVDLDRRGEEQLRLRDEENSRGQLGRSFNDRRNDPNAYDDRTGFSPGDCPRGYHVNDRPCRDDERQRGCQDTRSRSGKTCVGWRD